MKLKPTLFLASILLTVTLMFAAVGTTEITKTNSSTTSPVQLTTNSVKCRTIVLTGYKSARTPNTGDVWIQYNNSTNNSAGLKLQSGQTISITAGNTGLDASDIWIDPDTANDGVVAILFQ